MATKVDKAPPLAKSIQQVCLKKPLGLRIAEQGDKIVVLEVKQAGGAASWNASQEYQITAGDELVALYHNGQRVVAVGKTQEDVVGLVAAHTEPELKMEFQHVIANDYIEEVSVQDKELTYLIDLPKPLGLTIGADNNSRLVVLDIEEEGAAARWNEMIESTSDFSKQIRVGDRLVAYFQDGIRISIQRESYSGVVSHLKNHKGDKIDLELIHASKEPNRPVSAYLKGFRQFVSKATFRLQQKLTLGPEMDSFFVDLNKPLGMTVGSVQDRIVVTKINPKGNVSEWNELMARAVDGRHPNIRNQIHEGDQIVGVYDNKGLRVDLELTYASFVNYVQKQKQTKMTFQMMHLPPGLLRPPTKWKLVGHDSHMRSIAWRVFLGFVEKEESEDVNLFKIMLTRQRQDYVRLEKKYHVLNENEMEHLHKKFDINPLALTNENEGWRSLTENKDILETLRKDISRTFSELAFFQKQETQEMLERILFVWYKEQESQSDYQQGMHELLAVVIIVLLKDIHKARAQSVEKKSVDEIHEVANDPSANQVPVQWVDCVSRTYLEHDAYTIFSGLMNIALPFYTGASWLQGQSEHQQPFLYFRVQHIHYVLLQRYDPELFDHLEAAMVLPHLYLIRWLRLLFTREFNIEQSFIIWDVLLQSKGMELVDYVCVAMLSFIRDQLLAEDAAHCLTKVFHYPQLSNQDVMEVLRVAKALHDGEMLKFTKKGVLLFANKSVPVKPSIENDTETLLKRLVEQEDKAATDAIRDIEGLPSSGDPLGVSEASSSLSSSSSSSSSPSNPFVEEEIPRSNPIKEVDRMDVPFTPTTANHAATLGQITTSSSPTPIPAHRSPASNTSTTPAANVNPFADDDETETEIFAPHSTTSSTISAAAVNPFADETEAKNANPFVEPDVDSATTASIDEVNVSRQDVTRSSGQEISAETLPVASSNPFDDQDADQDTVVVSPAASTIIAAPFNPFEAEDDSGASPLTEEDIRVLPEEASLDSDNNESVTMHT